MNLRWLIGDYAEEEHGLDGRKGLELSARARRKHLPKRTFLLWQIFAVIVPVLLAFKFVVPMVLGWMGLTGRNPAYWIAHTVVLVAFCLWAAWVYRFVHVKPMRRAIRDTGRDLCIECGYDLAGLGDDIDKCPECGGLREPLAASP